VKALPLQVQPVSRSSLSDRIVDQIVELISTGVLKPGTKMPSENDLRLQFGVGRTSVREALRSLSVMGILTTQAGDGTYVSEDSSRYLQKTLQWGLLLDKKVTQDLIETRLMLECQIASLAATKADAASIADLRQSIADMTAAIHNPDAYLAADLRFHLGVAKAAQNSILHSLLSMIRGYLQAWIREALRGSADHDRVSRAELSVREHTRILKAIEAGRPDSAFSAMRNHILSSSAGLRAGAPAADGL
jgi:GntR family transcriptional regulator, transcriptional repressor for pyruvate dehydrogenase complex